MIRIALALLLCLGAGLSTGCGNDRACTVDSECFTGEYCGDGECVEGPRPANNAADMSSTNSQAPDMAAVDVGASDDGGVNNVGTDAGTMDDMSVEVDAGGTCQIDPIGNVCDEDEWEENDLYTQTLPIPIAQDSWCVDGNLAVASQSFSGTLCPGDQADLFRFLIDNGTPDECLAQTFTIRITVELDRPCDSSEFVRIFPYLSFDNPILNSPCGQDDDLRCTVSDDQMTYTFEWLWQAEQLVDQRLNIQPRGDDVQIDYSVTVEIVQ